MQALNFRGGIESQLIEEALTGILVGHQCVGRSPCPVQRDHEVRSQAFAKWVLGDQTSQLWHEVAASP